MDKKIIQYGVPVAAVGGVFLNYITDPVMGLVAGIAAGWAYFKY